MANAGTLQIMVVGDTTSLVASMHSGAKSVKALETASAKMSAQMLDEVRVLTMGADAAFDFKMALAGVDMATRDSVKAQREAVNALRDRAAAMKDADDRAFAEFLNQEREAARAASAAQEELANAVSRGKAVTDSVLSPVERYNKELADLNVLLKRGAISQETFNRAASGAKSRMDDQPSALDKIKKQFGSRGRLKDIAEIAVGGGAIAGIGFLTGTLRQATANAEKLSMEFRAGTKSTGEMVDESLKLVPIFGDIWATGRSIREVFLGEAAALAKVTAEAKRLDDTMSSIKKFSESVKSLGVSAGDTAKQFANEADRMALELLPDGPIREKAMIEFDIKADVSNAREELTRQFNDLTKEEQKRITDLNTQLKKMAQPEGRKTFYTGGGGIGGTAGVVQESESEFKKRMDEFVASQNTLRTEINQLQKNIDISRENLLGKEGSKFAEIEAAAAKKLSAELAALAQTQSMLATEMDQASTNRAFEKWADKFNAAKDAAKEILSDIKTPGQKFADQIKILDDLLQRNMITQSDYAKAYKKTRSELAGDIAIKQPEPIKIQFANVSDSSIGTGATDALAAQISASINAVVDTSIEKKQLAELQKQTAAAQELNRKIKIGDGN